MIELMKKLRQAKRKVTPLDPEQVYREAIEAHASRHEELRRAAASMLFVRVKLEGDLIELRAAIGRLHAEIRGNVRAGNESRAMMLISAKRRLQAELERREEELAEVKGDAEEAAERVVASADEKRSLEREKLRTIAALAVERSRARRVRDQALSEALEEVRGQISRIHNEARLERELTGEQFNRELGSGFDADEAARTELAMIRASVKRRCA